MNNVVSTPTYRVHFLGCKANQADALAYAGVLERAGWAEASEGQEPGVLLVQSCTVTMSADAAARNMVRHLKRQHPGSLLVLTGCFAQQLSASGGALPEADEIVGNLDPDRWKILERIAGKPLDAELRDFPMPAFGPRRRPLVKIQDGCDARCSYCIIPAVRGASRSLPEAEVIRRIAHFRDAGYREVVLTGISMGGYGKDLHPATSLARLVRKIDTMTGDFRVRLSSVEPEEIDDHFIDAFTSSSRFQPHLHLPLQSASDRVLKKMRRQYLLPRYDSIVRRISDKMPRLNLGTDLLVGFPDEDREAYRQTFRYVSEAPFGYAHVFPFSPRPGTPAQSYSSSAGHQEVTDRAAELRDLVADKNRRYRESFVGQSLRALMLAGSREALTDHYVRVKLRKPACAPDVVQIRVDSVEATQTWGSLIQ